MDFFNLRVPYYEKQGSLIYWQMESDTCECKNMSTKARDLLQEHLTTTGTKQDVAVVMNEEFAYTANCQTAIQVSIHHMYIYMCVCLCVCVCGYMPARRC